MHSCQNNPEKSYWEKKTKHALSSYSLLTNCLIPQKTNCVVTKVKTGWKGFVKT